jgi:hypothetical protein
VRDYADAGYDRIAIMNLGPDPDGFIEFFANELRPALEG